MKAPQRMDLLVSPMIEAGEWICPLHCKGCYATQQPAMLIDKSLSTEEWKFIIDKCREAGIPQLTFTGGEPTQRKDLIDLIDYAHWHVTRLNTNGINLTLDYAKKLFDANLDGVQVTLYSQDASVHDNLVGRKGAWLETVQSIKNLLEAGLSVSVNTPLVRVNSQYEETLKFIHGLGVKYVSCSGLIPAGGPSDAVATRNCVENAAACNEIIDGFTWHHQHAALCELCDLIVCIGLSCGTLAEIAWTKWVRGPRVLALRATMTAIPIEILAETDVVLIDGLDELDAAIGCELDAGRQPSDLNNRT